MTAEYASPDDIVDAEIHDEDCQGECPACFPVLRRRVATALAIHTPCHALEAEPWSCVHGHSDVETGLPYMPAECVACTYDDRVVTYPCPTTTALTGVDIPPF